MSMQTLVARWRGMAFDTTVEHPVAGVVFGWVVVALLVPVLDLARGASGPLGPSIPLVFLVPVMLAAVVGGRASGTLVSILAVVVWDWFFISPLYRVTIYYARDVVVLGIFLAVALLIGQLATSLRRRAAEAVQRAGGAEALYHLSTTLLARKDPAAVLSTLTQQLREAFGLRAVSLLLQDQADGRWRTSASAGDLPADLHVEANRSVHGVVAWVGTHGTMAGLPSQHLEFLPLTMGDRGTGVLELLFRSGMQMRPEDQRLLLTFANGAALALEQARHAEAEREAEVARESDRLKSALLSSVSHDLRTPLAGIKAAASSLLQTDVHWNAEEERGFIADIDAEADRLTRLVSNLLDLSRIEAGALRPAKEWEDLGDLIQRVVSRLGPALQEQISVQIAPRLPPAYVDPVQIEQVLGNLIENACKYSPENAPIIVSASTSDAPSGGREVRLVVADRGAGIPTAERTRIFDKFYRMVGARGRHPEGTRGTGMGLAIVKGLMEAHGGRVSVEDNPGGGSLFIAAVPLVEQEAQGPRGYSPAQPGDEPAKTSSA